MHMLVRRFAVAASLTSASVHGFSVVGRATRGIALRGGFSHMSEMTATPEQGTETMIPLSSVVVEPSSAEVSSWSGDLLVLPFWENQTALTGELEALNTAIGGALADLMEDNEFKGKAGSSATVALPRSSSVRKLTVLGLGEAEKFNTAAAKKFGVAIASAAKTTKAKAAAAAMPSGDALDTSIVQSAMEALYLELSPDTRYKSKVDDDAKPPPLTELALLGCSDADAVRRGKTVAAGILMTKGLVGCAPRPLLACWPRLARLSGVVVAAASRAQASEPNAAPVCARRRVCALRAGLRPTSSRPRRSPRRRRRWRPSSRA